ncbi:MAG: DUF4846 domain-containing protein [Christensenellaceae bacterium]|nr:DUF4846 domain-containing protein [Christensenellaceae bacterium]
MKRRAIQALPALAIVVLLASCVYSPKIIEINSLSPASQMAEETPPLDSEGPDALGESPEPPAASGGDTIAQRLLPPTGYVRINAPAESFQSFLRNYALKPSGSPVLAYDGTERANAGAAAVLKVDLGQKNHEGPAGAVLRLAAEYLFEQSRFSRISFTLGTQFDFSFDTWAEGKTLQVDGNSVKWVSGGDSGSGRDNFTRYLQTLFRYVSVDTLKKDMTLIEDAEISPIEAGDIFLGVDANGKPVCAMVADLVSAGAGGGRAMLLLEGGLPAQEAHIVQNPGDSVLSPWYECISEGKIQTPSAELDLSQRYRLKALS